MQMQMVERRLGHGDCKRVAGFLREFLSEAQAARARHYWTRESLEPYGVLPADATRSGKR